MRLDVWFTPGGLAAGTELEGRVVLVLDVLRATTTICAALSHGARAVIPVGSIDQAVGLARTLRAAAGDGPVLLAGERAGKPIAGFDLGNSPREMTTARVEGKTLIMTTTNGTGAILAAQQAAQVLLAAPANFRMVAARAREVWDRTGDLLILCAGRPQGFALEDGYTAGRLVEEVVGDARRRSGLNDGALAALALVRRYGDRWERPLLASQAGRDLIALGLRDDVLDAARADAYPVIPALQDRRIVPVEHAS
jgi:2-phosphosulfolactate phosphatase